ncbi:hypothetical protein OSC27_01140 [Microbacterium sp. STN6]|uniref:MutS-related protein n=1 Tax=Microbacterium sp. STN6 TaxID=2995588 RepID=UPI002260D8E2|nr:hypothetical protein [Microbacterium sp. STN6]MCX7520876.1 hypothetical protein [Microbacterium sp. STN6]
MKAFLMFPDRDFDPAAALVPHADDLQRDLELPALVSAMSAGDAFLSDVARAALLGSLTEPAEIEYRQHVLRDCLENPEALREMYALAVETITRQKHVFSWTTKYPPGILQHALELLEIFVHQLKILRAIAVDNASRFSSHGFSRFFAMLQDELDDDYFDEIDRHLRRLRLRDGVLVSANLGDDGHGAGLTLRRSLNEKPSLSERLSALTHPDPSFRIADRDEAGADALRDMRGQGINLVADALARSTDHILSFFVMLQRELGFYIGCLNVAERLREKGQHIAFPAASPPSRPVFDADGLYDVALALVSDDTAVGNDVHIGTRSLLVITGANRGGKSTLLRAIGLAQLMTQCGMYVGADALAASTCSALYTHFKREEDETMTSGKLDEELARMSDIADAVSPGGLVLFNESFASTNEREGSEIARQVVRALLDSRIRVAYVTHMYDLAHGFAETDAARTLFLRADRERTFSLTEAPPLTTSFGGDLYERIFETGTATGVSRPAAQETGAPEAAAPEAGESASAAVGAGRIAPPESASPAFTTRTECNTERA